MQAFTRRAALLGGAALAAAPTAAFSAGRRLEIPFKVTLNRPWTALTINGEGPFRCLIDTGASGFAISDAIARRLKLPVSRTVTAQAAVGKVRMSSYNVREVVVGGAVKDRDIYVLGWDVPEDAFIVGIVPASLFALASMGMDFDKGTMTVAPPRSFKLPDHEELPSVSRPILGKGGVALEEMSGQMAGHVQTLAEDYDPRPTIRAEIDGAPVKLLLDTGADSALFLFPDYVKRAGLWDRYPRWREGVSSGIAGLFETRLVRGVNLKLGSFQISRPVMLLGDPADVGRDGFKEADGVIGTEILRRFSFATDPQDQKVWLKPNAAFAEPIRYDRSGLSLERVEGRITVTAVEEKSAAHRAGLLQGDVIAAFAGEGGYEGLLWALQGPAGSVVDLLVEREGARTELGLRLLERL
ncbi:MAG TPA: aspartyl protease family protein [Caulobacteraceae bacterium]|nr:aspartyl protease family protein [Caulobacteraceae bacterium]